MKRCLVGEGEQKQPERKVISNLGNLGNLRLHLIRRTRLQMPLFGDTGQLRWARMKRTAK